MPDPGEKSGRNKMIDILQTFELEQCSYCEDHPNDEKCKTTPAYAVRQVDLVWIQWAEDKPGYPKSAHRCEDESKEELVFRIHLALLFKKFIA